MSDYIHSLNGKHLKVLSQVIGFTTNVVSVGPVMIGCCTTTTILCTFRNIPFVDPAEIWHESTTLHVLKIVSAQSGVAAGKSSVKLIDISEQVALDVFTVVMPVTAVVIP
ncbi:MAG: hypothetical protein IPP49_20060 [Saprospiraceae bacterium]|nr:hypothetical protein [Saprospiraceae bacterium]